MKIALRSLAKSRGFTAVAVLTLAFAIGVNSAVFALINAAVLRPVVPLRPEEVVNLFNGRRAAARDFRAFAHGEYLALRSARTAFADVAATSLVRVGLRTDQSVRRSLALFTSENYFALLGTRPMLGRFFNAEECRPNAATPVVVASYTLWQREGGHPDFVGRILQINGQSYTVIGVTPKGFNGVSAFMAYDLWLPLGVMGRFNAAPTPDLAHDETYALNLTARLAPGVTQATLSAQLPALGQLLTALPSNPSGAARELQAEPPSRQGVSNQPSGSRSATPMIIGLFSMSGCVLLIACLNLANLFLARGSQREKEIGVRVALGAGRWRIVRQLLTEGLILAAAGGGLGLLLAAWGNDLLLQSFAAIVSLNGESTALDLQPDAAVFGVTFLLCLAATLVFSLGPALKASGADPLRALKSQGGNHRTTGNFSRFFSLRDSLVMVQLALSLMLLFIAALFFRGAVKASSVESGVDPAPALVADLDYTLTSLRPEDARRSLFATLDHLNTQPGVQAVAAATFVPYSSRSEGGSVRPAGEPAGSSQTTNVLRTAITDGYFTALGVRLAIGRDFTAAEVRASGPARVAIIDDALARKLFRSGQALGERIYLGSTEAEVVGICAPHRHNNRRAAVPYRVFVPYGAGHDGRAFAVVRFAGSDASATAQLALLRRALRAFDAELPLLQLTPFLQLVEQDSTAWMARIGAILFGFFGALALLLAVVGVYGVKAYAVACRTREIGIRMAIGAQPGDVFALLLRQGMRQVAVATAVGVLLALGAGKVLAKMLYEVSPADALALGVSASLLAAAALVACVVPARRATKVDPMIALRAE